MGSRAPEEGAARLKQAFDRFDSRHLRPNHACRCDELDGDPRDAVWILRALGPSRGMSSSDFAPSLARRSSSQRSLRRQWTHWTRRGRGRCHGVRWSGGGSGRCRCGRFGLDTLLQRAVLCRGLTYDCCRAGGRDSCRAGRSTGAWAEWRSSGSPALERGCRDIYSALRNKDDADVRATMPTTVGARCGESPRSTARARALGSRSRKKGPRS